MNVGEICARNMVAADLAGSVRKEVGVEKALRP